MCGRYSLSMRPSQIRHHLRTDLHMPVSSSPPDEGDDAPRQTHNFAPTYRGVVYRADVPDAGLGRGGKDEGKEKDGGVEGEKAKEKGQGGGENGGEEVREGEEGEGGGEVQYKLQTMKWGLIPSWTKRAPDFSASLKTINCRSESLMSSHGMWTSMKQRKRCVVLVEGFYEWLHRGREKVPHYVKRKDGGMLCLAGLWDCVKYADGEKVYTYTIVTKGSNRQLAFLHDRMPVVLEPGGEEMWRWLDPGRGWGDDVARCLRGWDGGELEVFEVDRGVGKVGNDSPDFVVPVGKGKGKIEGFFGGKKGGKKEEEGVKDEGGKKEEVKDEGGKKEEVKDEGGKKEEVKDEGVKKEEVKDEGVKKEEEHDHKYNLRNEPTTKKEEPNEGDIKMESIENEPATKKEEPNEGDTKVDYIEDDNAEESDEPKQEITKEEADEKEGYKAETPKKEEADEKEEYKTETPKKEPPSTPSPVKKEESKQGIKREHDDSPSLDRAEPVKKATRTSASPVKVKESPSKTEGRGVRSSTRNDRGVVVPKAKKGEKGEQKITGFFGKK